MNPELHWSALKRIGQSPAHYKYGLDNPTPPSPSMMFGTLVHTMVLGGPPVAVYEGERRGKAWAEFRAENDGVQIVTIAEWERAQRCASAVLGDRVVQERGLLEGVHESSWTAKLYGRQCAGRIDVLHPRRVVELKTARDTRPGRLQAQCQGMSYHAQLAWYREAARVLDPVCREPREAWIIGVESSPPYVVTVLQLSESALIEGEKLNHAWLEQLAACEAVDEWPGYTQSPVPFEVFSMDALDQEDGDAT